MKDKDTKLLEEAYDGITTWNTTKNIIVNIDHQIQEAKRALDSEDDVESAMGILQDISNKINTFLMIKDVNF